MTVGPEYWQSAVFGLLSPDAIRRQLIHRVLAYLQDAGLAVSGWQPTRVTGQQVDEVARIQHAGAGETFRYRALDALFALGPSIALRLTDNRGRQAEEFYAAAKSVKGGIPQNSPAGTLRRDLGSVNVVMSLLHLSDNPDNAAMESSVMLGPGFEDRWLPGQELHSYTTALELTQAKETRGFNEVLAAVRGRIICSLWPYLTSAGKALAVELAQRGELADPKAGTLIAAETREPGNLRPLAELLCLAFDSSMPPVDVADVQRVLGLHRCELDPWEYAVLATSTYFEPIRVFDNFA
ncbi:MAG TPA: nucleoside-diphosphate kinase [Streptosporangiaceae bacterium]|nr:nucleoside-diphosphate kinase [Streptosporangiaceae bacterium]